MKKQHKIKRQFWITPEQDKFIKKEAKRQGISGSEIIRIAIEVEAGILTPAPDANVGSKRQ